MTKPRVMHVRLYFHVADGIGNDIGYLQLGDIDIVAVDIGCHGGQIWSQFPYRGVHLGIT
jgi:hypothetical protein